MPSCQFCPCRDGLSCLALQTAIHDFGRPVNPIGACIVPIVQDYCRLIQPGQSILEIGCGAWSPILERARACGARYEGIDTDASYYGRPTVATRIENLASLSFPDADFDFVMGNQCMEHWGEFGCSLSWGLLQAFRVCKPNGWVLMNVPIHFHGTKEFVHGDLNRLRKLLEPFSSTIEFTSWRSPASPLEEYHPHPHFWALRNQPAYVLDIRAQRNKSLPTNIANRTWGGMRIQRWLNYSFSFNLYRLFQKLGFLPCELD